MVNYIAASYCVEFKGGLPRFLQKIRLNSQCWLESEEAEAKEGTGGCSYVRYDSDHETHSDSS
jgi:hypothetical protein